MACPLFSISKQPPCSGPVGAITAKSSVELAQVNVLLQVLRNQFLQFSHILTGYILCDLKPTPHQGQAHAVQSTIHTGISLAFFRASIPSSFFFSWKQVWAKRNRFVM